MSDAVRKGENPGCVETRHLVEVERDRERLRVQYLDPSRVEEVENVRFEGEAAVAVGRGDGDG